MLRHSDPLLSRGRDTCRGGAVLEQWGLLYVSQQQIRQTEGTKAKGFEKRNQTLNHNQIPIPIPSARVSHVKVICTTPLRTGVSNQRVLRRSCLSHGEQGHHELRCFEKDAPLESLRHTVSVPVPGPHSPYLSMCPVRSPEPLRALPVERNRQITLLLAK